MRLVKLRNPWGKHQWTGKCNDRDTDFWNSLSETQRINLGYQKKNNGIFFMEWTDFILRYDMLDICKLQPTFSFNYQEFQCTSKNAKFFQLECCRGGKVYLGVHRLTNIFSTSKSKEQHFRITVIVGQKLKTTTGATKQQKDVNYVFKDAILQQNMNDCYLELDLQQGIYTVYAKIQNIVNNFTNYYLENNKLQNTTISCYSEYFTIIRAIPKDPTFLNKVYLDYARKSSERQFLTSNPSQKDWLLVKLVYAKGGFGLIIAQSSSLKVKINLDQRDFQLLGYLLKKPFKGNKKMMEYCSMPGQPLVILARLRKDFHTEVIKFPPQNVKVKTQKIK